jgi:FkbM family methyltransferase
MTDKSVRHIAKRALKATGVFPVAVMVRDYINRPGPNSNGVSLFADIKARLPHEVFKTVFDVGANVGQSAREIHSELPRASIYCFEPGPKAFQKLSKSLSRIKTAKAFNVAVGSENGRVDFECIGWTDTFHVTDRATSSSITVDTTTVADFCQNNSLDYIDLLKIDTEGHDFEVLRGARDMIAAAQIGVIQAECAANRDNSLHVQFGTINKYLEDKGYRLFGIYEQVHEWPTKKPNIRRFNAAYISPRVVERN